MGQNFLWHLRHSNQYNSHSSYNNSIRNNVSNYNNYKNINISYNNDSSSVYNDYKSSIIETSVNKIIINNESSLPESSSTIYEQLQNLSLPTAEKLSAFLQSSTTTAATVFDEPADSTIWSNWLFFLIIICITIGGIFGNASLIISLYTQSSARLRNPLLVGLCVADLMVAGVSAPLSIVTLIMLTHNEWIHSSAVTCKSLHFMQVSH